MNFYIRVITKALCPLVDEVGGVTVHNDLDWIDEGH
jgi:polyisoprenyl-teichoic acid--peptidoglycan teichoic acid transferase